MEELKKEFERIKKEKNSIYFEESQVKIKKLSNELALLHYRIRSVLPVLENILDEFEFANEVEERLIYCMKKIDGEIDGQERYLDGEE